MKVAVIGNGVMGKGIIETLLCQESSTCFESIIWIARDFEKSHQHMKLLTRQVRKTEKRLNDQGYIASDILSKVFITGDYNEIRDASIIIEAVSEDLSVKKNIISEINKYRNLDSVVASNTSSYSITELATLLKTPSHLVGLHFFNPAPVMKLVEVVRGLTTDEDIVSKMVSFAKLISKEPVVVNEAPGFIVNRMLIPMINEAIAIYAEGIADIPEIDKAMKLGANHPIGPFALSDLIGNDVVLSILNTLYTETGDAKYRPHTLLKKYVRANMLGRKTRSGFYSH